QFNGRAIYLDRCQPPTCHSGRKTKGPGGKPPGPFDVQRLESEAGQVDSLDPVEALRDVETAVIGERLDAAPPAGAEGEGLRHGRVRIRKVEHDELAVATVDERDVATICRRLHIGQAHPTIALAQVERAEVADGVGPGEVQRHERVPGLGSDGRLRAIRRLEREDGSATPTAPARA